MNDVVLLLDSQWCRWIGAVQGVCVHYYHFICSSSPRIVPCTPPDWLPGIMVHLLVTFGRYPGVYWYGVAVW